MDDQQMDVLICGGLSFLGYHLSVALLQRGDSVLSIDRFYDERQARPEAHLARLRLQQLEVMNHLDFTFINHDPCDIEYDPIKRSMNAGIISHVVYIPEGLSSEPFSQESSFSNTVPCMTRIMESLKKVWPRPYFTFISSTAVYDLSGQVWTESASPSSPQSVRAALWLHMEATAEQYHLNHHLPVLILRAAHVYGPWMGLQQNLLKLAQAAFHATDHSESWSVESLGIARYLYVETQDFIFVSDAVNGIICAMTRRFSYEIINIGSERNASYLNMHDIMYTWVRDFGQSNFSSDTEVNHWFYFTEEQDALVFPQVNCSKAKQLLNFEINVTESKGLPLLLNWYTSFNNHIFPNGKHDFIFTSFFTSKPDPQRNITLNQNSFAYMKNWFWSVCDNSLKAVLFHDRHAESFIKRLAGNVVFKLSSLGTRTTNDARFYLYLNYLQANSYIQRVFLTDISDVTFQKNPFHLMNILGDHLYIGTDIEIFPRVSSMEWLVRRMLECFNNNNVMFPGIERLHYYSKVYNAGVIGGSRTVMLEFLERLVGVLDKTPANINCNMAATNYVAHWFFSDRLFTGFPLTSRFWKRQQHPKGVYIIHK